MSGKSKLLEPVRESDRVSIAFKDICTWAKNLDLDSSFLSRVSRVFEKASSTEERGKSAGKKQILFNVNGEVEPGEILALMGPSGSGKTTLVSALGCRLPKKMEMKGEITVNDRPMTKAARRKIGFVSQDDLLYGTLTVLETIRYAAFLRLPNDLSRIEKERRVEDVIAALGLNKCRDTLIGNEDIKGVSGGERKRVAVGHELVTNPSCLILDEPTSGLDSTKAMQLVTMLRALAQGGRSVIATIHQPASRLYQQLDTLMLLSQGRTMYYGRADLAMHWFNSVGYSVPVGMNIADFIVDLANGNSCGVGIARSRTEMMQQLTEAFQPFSGKIKGISSKADLEQSNTVQLKNSVWTLKKLDQRLPELGVNGKMLSQDPAKTRGRRIGAGYLEQVRLLTGRAIKTRRFESLGFLRFLNTAAPGGIVGLLWWQSGGDDTVLGALNVSGLLFFEVLYVQVKSGYVAINSLPPIYQLTIKERVSGMYQLSAFYLATSISDLPLECCFPSIFIALMYWGGGLRATAAAFLWHWFSMLLGMFVAQAIGMLIGAIFMSQKEALTCATIVFITTFMTGGFYIRSMPPFVAWLKYINLNFYSFNIAMKLEYSGRKFFNCGGLGAREANEFGEIECKPVTDLKSALSFVVDVDAPIWVDLGALFLLLVFFRLLVYLVLKHRTRN
ncbi:hypothetical protein BSKO_02129 [Bryopsis sp. KO-2023]|nr:hypothetical protein BSKO_02129 [Bryopsis sp. KO-2023]